MLEIGDTGSTGRTGGWLYLHRHSRNTRRTIQPLTPALSPLSPGDWGCPCTNTTWDVATGVETVPSGHPGVVGRAGVAGVEWGYSRIVWGRPGESEACVGAGVGGVWQSKGRGWVESGVFKTICHVVIGRKSGEERGGNPGRVVIRWIR